MRSRQWRPVTSTVRIFARKHRLSVVRGIHPRTPAVAELRARAPFLKSACPSVGPCGRAMNQPAYFHRSNIRTEAPPFGSPRDSSPDPDGRGTAGRAPWSAVILHRLFTVTRPLQRKGGGSRRTPRRFALVPRRMRRPVWNNRIHSKNHIAAPPGERTFLSALPEEKHQHGGTTFP